MPREIQKMALVVLIFNEGFASSIKYKLKVRQIRKDFFSSRHFFQKTNKFDFTSCRLVFVRFLEERHFEINWPLGLAQTYFSTLTSEIFTRSIQLNLKKNRYHCSLNLIWVCSILFLCPFVFCNSVRFWSTIYFFVH